MRGGAAASLSSVSKFRPRVFEAFVGGALCPVVGRVSMDVCAVDVTGREVAVGDAAELFGPNRLLDDAAAAAGTVAWELLTSVGPRVTRRYID